MMQAYFSSLALACMRRPMPLECFVTDDGYTGGYPALCLKSHPYHLPAMHAPGPVSIPLLIGSPRMPKNVPWKHITLPTPLTQQTEAG